MNVNYIVLRLSGNPNGTGPDQPQDRLSMPNEPITVLTAQYLKLDNNEISVGQLGTHAKAGYVLGKRGMLPT